jgi:hypothetical protein
MTRFRFTLRELMLLVLVAAVCLAWWVDHERDRSRIKDLNARIERMELELERVYRTWLGQRIDELQRDSVQSASAPVTNPP